MVIASTNRSVDVIGGKLTVGTYLLKNYKTLVSQQPIRGNLFDSCRIITVAVTLCLALIISSLWATDLKYTKIKRKKRYALVP